VSCGRRESFGRWIKESRLPLLGTSQWDLKAIDHPLDLLSGLKITEIYALDDRRLKRLDMGTGLGGVDSCALSGSDVAS
jgi:hypothetical protein